MKQTEGTIMGQGYLLGCPHGGEEALQQAVAQVDREMCAIRDAGRVKARDRIAVLAALNLAYALAERPPSDSVSAATSGPRDDAHEHEIAQLIARIDQALGADGRLI